MAQDYKEHREKIFSKLVAILQDIVDTNCLDLQVSHSFVRRLVSALSLSLCLARLAAPSHPSVCQIV